MSKPAFSRRIITRRTALIGGLSGLLAANPHGWAQSTASAYPGKAIRLIIPFPPGGATDIFGRLLAQELSKSLGQQVVVDNKPGAGGAIGTDLLAKSPADGYTIMLATSSTHAIGPALNSKLPYNMDRDFAPVAYLCNATNVLIVAPQLGVNSVKELVALARSKPGVLNYGSSGIGTIVHLTGEMFARATGAQMAHIPYKGTALVIPDLAAGQISLLFDNIASVQPHLKGGKVKPLAISSRKRSPLIPDLPTVAEAGAGSAAEAGLRDFESTTFFGVFAPAGTPRDIVTRLNADIDKAIRLKEMQDRFVSLGVETVGGSVESFAQAWAQERQKWAKVVREVGLKTE
jgi:tripartite-type tricarboxylate transporter receptor subunit TctC